MSLKGSAGGAARRCGRTAGAAAPGSGGVGEFRPHHLGFGLYGTPDETAHGEYMKLMASAGLAFDRVHLDYLSKGKLRINSTTREQGGKVIWRVERLRPNLPASETEPPRTGAATDGNQ